AGIPFVDPNLIRWPAGISCDANLSNPAVGRTAYPGGKYEDITYMFGNGAAETFFNKKQSFYIAGCFIYKTFKNLHRSPYCLYFQPHRDRKIEDATFEFCPQGGGIAD